MNLEYNVVNIKRVIDDITNWKRNGNKIVLVTGCFDIIHAGHIKFLEQASYLGNILVIGLNSDESVNQLKGYNRPINNVVSRAYVLRSIEYVHEVVVFDDKEDLINRIQPTYLVEGEDYKDKEIVGRELVEKYGGEVKFVSFLEGYSTTDIIDKIVYS